jgi:hypothetical protein
MHCQPDALRIVPHLILTSLNPLQPRSLLMLYTWCTLDGHTPKPPRSLCKTDTKFFAGDWKIFRLASEGSSGVSNVDRA